MPIFDFRFTVDASLQTVSDFHHDTAALKMLTPPPAFIQLHDVEPLGEGSVAEFTVWAGPLPLRWKAVHTNVSVHGFTDTQLKGLNESWVHTHRFEVIDTTAGHESTEVIEHIEFEYNTGWKGVLGRLMFNPPALKALFHYRAWRTRRAITPS